MAAAGSWARGDFPSHAEIVSRCREGTGNHGKSPGRGEHAGETEFNCCRVRTKDAIVG